MKWQRLHPGNSCAERPARMFHGPCHTRQPTTDRLDTTLIMTSNLDLDEIYHFAVQLGKDAGKLLQDAAQQRMNGGDQLEEVEKLNSVDIVTKTDEGNQSLPRRANFGIICDVENQY